MISITYAYIHLEFVTLGRVTHWHDYWIYARLSPYVNSVAGMIIALSASIAPTHVGMIIDMQKQCHV